MSAQRAMRGEAARAAVLETAVRQLNQTTTQEARRQLLRELPRRVLPSVRAHFAGYGDCFPVGAAVVALIDRLVGTVRR